jgi:hypothetical protein
MLSIRHTELIAALQTAGTEMESLLAQVGDARLAEPGVSEAWSVKDLLAHITAWEERILAWMDALAANTTPKPAGWSKDWTEEQINEWIFESNQARTATDIVTRWRDVHQSVLNAAQILPEATLFDQKIEWLNNGSLADSIPGNSYEHILAHAEAIRTWLSTHPAT